MCHCTWCCFGVGCACRCVSGWCLSPAAPSSPPPAAAAPRAQPPGPAAPNSGGSALNGELLPAQCACTSSNTGTCLYSVFLPGDRTLLARYHSSTERTQFPGARTECTALHHSASLCMQHGSQAPQTQLCMTGHTQRVCAFQVFSDSCHQW